MQTNTVWQKTNTEVEIYTSSKKLKILKGVPALKHKDSDQMYVNPLDVSRIEMEYLAKENSLKPREIPILLLLCAKIFAFEEGKIQYKYHMNKMLFYLWKYLEEEGLVKAFPNDEFEAALRGPVPVHISEDLENLKEKSLLDLQYYRWGEKEKDSSLQTELTKKGKKIAKEIWSNIDEPIRQLIIKAKDEIFLKTPEEVKIKVHNEYPEYKKEYIEVDIA